MSQLFARKTVDQCVADGAIGGGLRRSLGPLQLTALGIGAIIGAGIFAAIGTAISGDAGHVGAGSAIVLSIILAGVTSAFAAITYSEFAAMIPISGSAYTYAYATLGELLAWIIGWDLILEYAVGNIAVAIGWAGYFDSLLRGLGVELPQEIVKRPKRGFTLPFESWLRGEMRSVVETTLLRNEAGQMPFDPDATREVWKRFLAGETSWSRPWSLFVLKRWCEKNL